MTPQLSGQHPDDINGILRERVLVNLPSLVLRHVSTFGIACLTGGDISA